MTHAPFVCATCGAPIDMNEVLARARVQRPTHDDLGVDEDGRRMSIAPEHAAHNVDRVFEGKHAPLFMIAQAPNGDVATRVYAPPSQQLVDILEQVTRGLKLALRKT
jgi:hypothetical protein